MEIQPNRTLRERLDDARMPMTAMGIAATASLAAYLLIQKAGSTQPPAFKNELSLLPELKFSVSEHFTKECQNIDPFGVFIFCERVSFNMENCCQKISGKIETWLRNIEAHREPQQTNCRMIGSNLEICDLT